MNSSFKIQLLFVIFLSCLVLPNISLAQNPHSLDLINQRGDLVQPKKNILQRLDDWFNGPAPWEIVTTPIEENIKNIKDYIWGTPEQTPCGPIRYEYVGPRSEIGGENIHCSSSVEFCPPLDALHDTPNDWQDVDYRKGKQVLSQQCFINRFGQKKKKKKMSKAKVVYKPKQKKKRLGRVDFSKHLPKLKKVLHRCENATVTEREWNSKTSEIWERIKTDITTMGRQCSLLSLIYRDNDSKEKNHWLLAYKIEGCYIKEVGKGNETKRKAFAIEVIDLDPYRSARLKDMKKACFRLFYIKNHDKFGLENTFIDTFEKARPIKEHGEIQPNTFVGENTLYWYNMAQLKFN